MAASQGRAGGHRRPEYETIIKVAALPKGPGAPLPPLTDVKQSIADVARDITPRHTVPTAVMEDAMKTDHLQTFPLPAALIPPRLRAVLAAEGDHEDSRITVTERYEHDIHGMEHEYLHMLMAAIPTKDADSIGVLRESSYATVEHGRATGGQGAARDFSPSVSSFDYIVASWSDGQSFTFALAERVWMTLGLTARAVGNKDQRLTYDDLSAPFFDVAHGEVSSGYYFRPSRNVHWTMSNGYLRQYLFLRDAVAARVFFYECLLPDGAEIRAVMAGSDHIEFKTEAGWYEVNLMAHRGGILLQVWATVTAVPPILLTSADVKKLKWPDIDEATASHGALSRTANADVYLDDRALEYYERNSIYDTTPVKSQDGHWYCAPSYGGYWSFSDWQRFGRNLIHVPLHALRQGIPPRELARIHPFALPLDVVEQRKEGEHIVMKVDRLVTVMLDLAQRISDLSVLAGTAFDANDVFALSRGDVERNGWGKDAMLRRLSQTAPLDMTEQAFLERCKIFHERWQKMPNNKMNDLLHATGIPKRDLKGLGTLKLIQALANVTEGLNREHVRATDAFPTAQVPGGWMDRNDKLAALFVAYDLRNAEAHVAPGNVPQLLESLDYDIAGLNSGYGLALDHVIDGVINALAHLDAELAAFLDR